MKGFIPLLSFSLFLLVSSSFSLPPPSPTNLRIEYETNPLGIDNPNPSFSWSLASSSRAQHQTAFQILVSTSSSLSPADMWDTGKLTSSQSTHVRYQGKALQSDRTYYWAVKWWDATGAESTFSSTQSFGTAFLSISDWKANWISPNTLSGSQLRKEFTLPTNDTIVRARAFVTGLGYYELRINGQKASRAVLDPAWTTFSSRVLYSVLDVAKYLDSGPNAIAVYLGNGWFDQVKRLLFQLHITLRSGKLVQIVSDSSWSCGPEKNALVSNSIYNGETYDARLETPGWDQPEYFPSPPWSKAVVMGPVTETPALSSLVFPAVEVIQEFTPVKKTQPASGVYVFDFGQNFSGFCRIKLAGPVKSGTQITLRHAEVLTHPPYGPIDGSIYVGNLRTAKATDVYISADIPSGKSVEHQPRFTYHGFRYVELTGFPYEPQEDALTCIHFRSKLSHGGDVSFDAPLLNEIQHNIRWGQSTNFMSVPTDCDQRDERKGWMGDAGLTVEEAFFNFDAASFYTNFVRNIRDSQLDPLTPHPAGSVPDTSPFTFGSYPADPAWGLAFPKIVYYIYKHYGDVNVIRNYYQGLLDWAGFLEKQVTQSGLEKLYSYYGDWVPPPDTQGGGQGPKPNGSLTSSWAYITTLIEMAEMSKAVGNTTNSQYYEALAQKRAQQFHQVFYDPSTTSYGTSGLQSAIVFAFSINAVPSNLQTSVIKTLVDDIAKRNQHLSTGILGVSRLGQVLTEYGFGQVALQILLQTDYPSYGYMIHNTLEPATTLWELWDSPAEGPGMNSRNHHMFGSIGAFFYSHLLGIQQQPGTSGFEQVIFKPRVVSSSQLNSARGFTSTLAGNIALSWSKTSNPTTFGFELNITVPVNSVGNAFVYCGPKGCSSALVTEGGTTIWRGGFISGVSGIFSGAITEDGYIMFSVGSGEFLFSLQTKVFSH